MQLRWRACPPAPGTVAGSQPMKRRGARRRGDRRIGSASGAPEVVLVGPGRVGHDGREPDPIGILVPVDLQARVLGVGAVGHEEVRDPCTTSVLAISQSSKMARRAAPLSSAWARRARSRPSVSEATSRITWRRLTQRLSAPERPLEPESRASDAARPCPWPLAPPPWPAASWPGRSRLAAPRSPAGPRGQSGADRHLRLQLVARWRLRVEQLKREDAKVEADLLPSPSLARRPTGRHTAACAHGSRYRTRPGWCRA